jgi:hypothetical protein
LSFWGRFFFGHFRPQLSSPKRIKIAKYPKKNVLERKKSQKIQRETYSKGKITEDPKGNVFERKNYRRCQNEKIV